MGTSKHVAILLIVVLTGLLTAGQDQPTASSQAAPRGPSNTRSTRGLLRITVDPAILPLNEETVDSLIHSPAVLLQAAHEALSFYNPADLDRLNKPQDSGRPLLMIKWLSDSSGPASSGMSSLQRLPGETEVAYRTRVAQTRAAPTAPAPQDQPVVQIPRTPGESDVAYRTRVTQVRNAQQALRAQQQALQEMKSRSMGSAAPRAMVELQVHLPDTVPALAEEFLTSVVKNLQESLSRAHESYQEGLAGALIEAKTQHVNVENELDGGENDVARVKQQLETVADLSELTPEMPLATAVEVLKKSVEPPLNLVVLWNDLRTNLTIEPSAPVGINGLPKVKVGTVLDLLVKGLPLGEAKATWRIKDDTVVIGTTAVLGGSPGATGQPRVETDAGNLAAQRSDLVRRIQSLELDLAGLDARQKAIRERISSIKLAADKQLADDRVTQELERLEDRSRLNLANLEKQAEAGRVTASDLAQAEESAARIRIDLARRREELSRQAGGGQLEEFTKELSHLAVDKVEKEAQLKVIRKQLDEVQKQLAAALTFDPEAARLRLAQESLDIAARRVAELQMRLTNLQPPMVTVIGAN